LFKKFKIATPWLYMTLAISNLETLAKCWINSFKFLFIYQYILKCLSEWCKLTKTHKHRKRIIIVPCYNTCLNSFLFMLYCQAQMSLTFAWKKMHDISRMIYYSLLGTFKSFSCIKHFDQRDLKAWVNCLHIAGFWRFVKLNKLCCITHL